MAIKRKKLKDKQEYVSDVNRGSGISEAVDSAKLQQSKGGNPVAYGKNIFVNKTKSKMKTKKPKVYKSKKKDEKKQDNQDPKWYFGKGLKKLTGSTKRRLNKLVKKGKVTTPDGKKVTEKYKSKLGESVEKKTGRIRKGAQSAVQTKGGTFATYKKDSGAAKSFREAFKQARAKGVGTTFTWDGRKYKAETADDVKKRKASNNKTDKKAMGGYQKKYGDGGTVGAPVATYAYGGYVEGE